MYVLHGIKKVVIRIFHTPIIEVGEITSPPS